jgi:putative phage-type endonuclease
MTTAIQLETPTGVLLGHFQPGTPEWAEARDRRMTSSRIAAVLGLSRFDSRFSLWHRMAGRIAETPQNDEMEAGIRLEPAICGKFADEHPDLAVVETGTFVHVDRTWQVATPDRLVSTRIENGSRLLPVAALEAKFALFPDEWGDPGTDEIPPMYLAQTRWQLDTLGLDTCHVQVFFGACAEFREYTVRRHDDDQAMMRERAQEFLESIRLNQRPAIDAHSATYRAVRELHPLITPDDAEIDPALADGYTAACTAYTTAKAGKQRAVSQVLDAMGNAKYATVAGQRIAMRVAQKTDALPHLRPARNGKAPS